MGKVDAFVSHSWSDDGPQVQAAHAVGRRGQAGEGARRRQRPLVSTRRVSIRTTSTTIWRRCPSSSRAAVAARPRGHDLRHPAVVRRRNLRFPANGRRRADPRRRAGRRRRARGAQPLRRARRTATARAGANGYRGGRGGLRRRPSTCWCAASSPTRASSRSSSGCTCWRRPATAAAPRLPRGAHQKTQAAIVAEDAQC